MTGHLFSYPEYVDYWDIWSRIYFLWIQSRACWRVEGLTFPVSSWLYWHLVGLYPQDLTGHNQLYFRFLKGGSHASDHMWS